MTWIRTIPLPEADEKLRRAIEAQRAKIRTWADSMQAWMEQHRQMMNPSQH